MNFEGVTVAVENAGEAILSDTEFREGPASQRFEELVRVAPLRSHDLVEFRDDSILNVWIERVELRCRS